MGKVNYAAIDIGSNAVRLLIKSIDREAVQEKKIKKVMMLRVPLRLGFDVFSIGELSEKKADKLRRLMKAFRQLMKIYDVDDYRACATSAMRDARNGRTIIKKIEKDTGIRIEIIDGQEEARMIYNNHIPPENIGNWIATEQSDIYMFWITMYRLINWDSHFISQIDQLSHDDILLKIKKWEFPNRKYYLPHVHEKLRKIFNKCMNLDLSKRYSSAREIRGDLSKLKLIYNWKSITKEVDLLRYHWFMGDKLVYELVCERNNEWLWQLTFLKIWKKSIKVGRYSHKLLTINELNRKLEEIFFQFF